MEVHFTEHAKERMIERAISEKRIALTLEKPTKVSMDKHGRYLIKKLYRKNEKIRLLLIVAERIGHVISIVTVIETSKVKKYL